MPEQSAPDNIPDGLTLRHTLRGHTSTINQIAWSPDGHCIASPSRDDTIRLWDAESGSMLLSFWCHFGSAWSVVWSPDGRTLASGSSDNTIYLWETAVREPVRTLDGHSNTVWSVSWSPDGQMLASGSKDKTVRLWSAVSGELLRTLEGHLSEVYSIAWSPDGRTLASGGRDNAICVWDVASGRLLHTLKSHFRSVYSVAWSPDGRMLAAGSNSEAIQLWDSGSGRQARFLEGHTDYVRSVSFSFDGKLLASKSGDRTVRLWRTDTWETVAILDESVVSTSPPSLAFHPSAPVLATLGEKDTVIRIWDLDYSELLGIEPETPTVHYANARVVLVGDTGVGKTGLGLVLTGRPFVPTESTHGRHVWAFDRQEAQLPNGRRETRETLLWDLAGQPGYRLVHQLSLNEVAVALVVFDARSETDPFSGVRHWERALRQAQRAQGDAAPLMFKYLVAARTDRGGIAASQERIAATMRSLGFDGYYETSAKEGWGIEALTEAIRYSIDWVNLPKVSSTELFTQIKEFLVEEKSAGHLLATAEDLYRAFLRTENAPPNTDDLRAQFETCIGRVESRGLIQRLSFGDLVLLQPELLAAYASAMINAARAEPDGLGCLHEEDARTGRFLMTDEIRLRGQEQERLLLLATIEEMLRHEIALREDTEHGPHLVFPSQFTREWPDEPDPEGKAVIFRFDGPVLNVYATLAVRLSRSGLLNKDEMWRNAATYTATVGGRCGIWLREVEEGRGELTLFYDAGAIEATRFQFEEYVRAHLQRRALPGSIVRSPTGRRRCGGTAAIIGSAATYARTCVSRSSTARSAWRSSRPPPSPRWTAPPILGGTGTRRPRSWPASGPRAISTCSCATTARTSRRSRPSASG
jgi:WD40 repeat protein